MPNGSRGQGLVAYIFAAFVAFLGTSMLFGSDEILIMFSVAVAVILLWFYREFLTGRFPFNGIPYLLVVFVFLFWWIGFWFFNKDFEAALLPATFGAAVGFLFPDGADIEEREMSLKIGPIFSYIIAVLIAEWAVWALFGFEGVTGGNLWILVFSGVLAVIFLWVIKNYFEDTTEAGGVAIIVSLFGLAIWAGLGFWLFEPDIELAIWPALLGAGFGGILSIKEKTWV